LTTTPTADEFLALVRRIVADRVTKLVRELADFDAGQIMPGKMLRSRLAARLIERGSGAEDPSIVADICAAVELAHTASLCHDDVIDSAEVRRGMPSLWCITGASGAVLVGDLLLCEAMGLMVHTESGKHLPGFLDKLRQVVVAEARGELLRGTPSDEATCLDLARGKTGPLFAFAAGGCGGGDEELAAALQEAGYCIGTAYQLADDLLDRIGDEDTAGKTLGTDALRGKFTLAGDGEDNIAALCRAIQDLLESATGCLARWEAAVDAVRCYIAEDIHPLLQRLLDRKLIVWEDSLT